MKNEQRKKWSQSQAEGSEQGTGPRWWQGSFEAGDEDIKLQMEWTTTIYFSLRVLFVKLLGSMRKWNARLLPSDITSLTF